MYEWDKNVMPGNMPSFNPQEAVWATETLYRAIQLVLLREIGEEAIPDLLKEYPEEMSPEVIYSADLVLRQLPHLFNLAKGLAPDDKLVTHLKLIAQNWPFSSVGIEAGNEISDHHIFSCNSLRIAYIDRIIKYQDLKRVQASGLESYITEATGIHINEFWPDFKPNTELS